MIDNSDVVISAWVDGKMIGVARALTDFSYCCYLSDLAVDKNYQQHGVGRELVEQVRAKIGDECALILLSAPGAIDYYPRLGFDRVDNAFVIKRKSN
ncbi:MAG: GNAT family N-acetyltransferase [Paenibacillaceae bacterium]